MNIEDPTDLKALTPAQIEWMEENDPKAFEKYEAAVATKQKVIDDLGLLADPNKREALTNRLLLSLLEGTEPQPADVEAFKRAIESAKPITG